MIKLYIQNEHRLRKLYEARERLTPDENGRESFDKYKDDLKDITNYFIDSIKYVRDGLTQEEADILDSKIDKLKLSPVVYRGNSIARYNNNYNIASSPYVGCIKVKGVLPRDVKKIIFKILENTAKEVGNDLTIYLNTSSPDFKVVISPLFREDFIYSSVGKCFVVCQVYELDLGR